MVIFENINKAILKNIYIDIDINKAILKNIYIDIDINKAILKNINIDIDKKSWRSIDIDKGIIKI